MRKDFANLLAGKHRLLVAAVQRVLLCPKLSKTRAEEKSEERADEKKKEGAKDGRRWQEGEGPSGWGGRCVSGASRGRLVQGRKKAGRVTMALRQCQTFKLCITSAHCGKGKRDVLPTLPPLGARSF